VRATIALVVLLALGCLGPSAWAAGAEDFGVRGKTAPLFLPLDQVKIEIANVKFEVEIQGVDGPMRMPENRRDKYRLALVTLRIRKPPGMKLTIAAADLTFHYYHGTDPEVAPAEGLSYFSTSIDGDRPMKLWQSMGPGWVKQTTNPRATEAGELYVDVVFHMIEPDTRECWVGIAQSCQQAPYIAKGWGTGEK